MLENNTTIVNELKEDMLEIEVENAIEIDAAPNGNPIDYKKLNSMIHEAVNCNYKRIILNNVCGQRFIGAALKGDFVIKINGIPGNDLGIFMDGPKIIVNGNCEDQSGNTMNNGTIIIDGDGGDVIGLSSRGGKIFIKGNVGYRVGIHMKEYQDKSPLLIIGGTAKDFLGEYMAGGKIIILGLEVLSDNIVVENKQSICGNELGTGIHRGCIYLRTDEDLGEKLGVGAKSFELSREEWQEIAPFIADFCNLFNIPKTILKRKSFKVIKPISKRPFGGNYCSQII
jgi:glutamate synthase domain-containing protein 3